VEEFFLLDLGGVKKRVAEEMRIEKSNQVWFWLTDGNANKKQRIQFLAFSFPVIPFHIRDKRLIWFASIINKNNCPFIYPLTNMHCWCIFATTMWQAMGKRCRRRWKQCARNPRCSPCSQGICSKFRETLDRFLQLSPF
jgi:hypothetical protein